MAPAASSGSLMLTDSLSRRLEEVELLSSLASLAAWKAARPDSGGEVLDVAGGKALFFGAGAPLSQALRLGMNGDVTVGEVEELENFYKFRGCGITISLCPYADPSLIEILSGRGYRITHFEHTLYRALPAPEEFPSEAGVRPADIGDRDTWVCTVLEGFFSSAQDTAMLELLRAMFSCQGGTPFLAELEGEPAAGGSILVSGDAALLAGDATRPSYRGRGLQSALIRARLAHAAAQGCTLAMACTMPGSTSQRNYERAGFRVAYTKVMLQKD
jgi:GNAT superfamily N-acetyltransferase